MLLCNVCVCRSHDFHAYVKEISDNLSISSRNRSFLWNTYTANIPEYPKERNSFCTNNNILPFHSSLPDQENKQSALAFKIFFITYIRFYIIHDLWCKITIYAKPYHKYTNRRRYDPDEPSFPDIHFTPLFIIRIKYLLDPI